MATLKDIKRSTMVDRENYDRIQLVEKAFGPSGKPLADPGRILVGEGILNKLCRNRPKPRIFFLFNDVLVYGSIILKGRWHKKQHIIPLEDIELEDLENGMNMENQWLLKTPRKSFFVSAPSPKEKQAWMEHIQDCRTKWLQKAGRKPSNAFAVTWIPDQASAICMRCFEKFTLTHRRHHCRSCGFIVCNPCSKDRAMLPHLSSKPVRVCKRCTPKLQDQGVKENRPRGGSDGMNCSSDEDDQLAPEYESSSDENEEGM